MDLKNKLYIFNTFGISGAEDKIKNELKNNLSKFADEVLEDRNNSIIFLKKGKGKNPKKIMFAAHMDSIGFIVTHIDEKGFIRFHEVGFQPVNSIIHKKVIFESGIFGVISTDGEFNEKNRNLTHLYVDIGTKSKEETEKFVKIGDRFAIDAKVSFNDNIISGAWLDDRIGCFVLAEVLENLKNNYHDIYFVFTSQEEVGLRGAKTSAYKISPDLGIAIDITGSFDTPKIKPYGSTKFFEGAAIKIMDSSVIPQREVVNYLIKIAEKHNIKYQRDILTFGGTDTMAIQLTKSGILAGGISIPTRYGHSAVEMCALSDVQAVIDLALKVCEDEINDIFK